MRVNGNYESIWLYIKDRKTPVTTKQIAKYFIISQTKASKALNSFVEDGLVDFFYVGNTKYFKVKNGRTGTLES